MNRNAKWRNTTLGVVVLLGLLVFIFLLFKMGGAGFLTSNLEVYAKFSHVKGLHEGSEVSLAGLRIGVVKEITISTDGSKNLIVTLSISEHQLEKIRKDSSARIQTQGVLGDKYVEIDIGSIDSDPIQAGDYIASADDLDILGKGGKLFDGISKQMEKGGSLSNVLNNLDQVTQNLVTLTSIKPQKSALYSELFYGDSGKKLQSSVNHLDSILEKIDRGDGTMGSLINDPSVYDDVKQMLGNAKRSSILRFFVDSYKDKK